MSHTLVTGANRGIGLELCKQLKARGAKVIAVCRKASPELEALGVRVESGVDVSDAGSVKELAQRLSGVSLDLLINNAGILRGESLAALDFDGIAEQFEVNAMGPLRVTAALAPLLSKDAKVAIITSRMGSMADNGSGGYYGYRMSKAAVNAAGVSLARDMKARGVAVALLHPGMVATEMTGKNGIPADESVRGLLARIDALTLETSGKFFHAGTGEELPW
ncbi:SDR family oxidoreductase [Terricaulis sp.]|uniref:SDR family oxidoreductase n=1 Tax=Terricaulis sp. TaxID=2768686 RepID=UPI002AC421E9|nr:SDR family oxidoreductase [Terricaulis sp.]MDZ4690736.1 SDR family oxidoreductase [Terricaulis sp.]